MMLLIFQPNHCEIGAPAFYQLYIPLFLVNNIFITIMAFLYWIVVEKRDEGRIRALSPNRFGTIDGVESPMDEYSEKSGFVNHSFYDNVYPWEYIKPKKPLPAIAPSQATYL
ncbi:hypothetical protein WR25_08698 [Diploscapter pachys]|uniref:Uncharacterized protein n=1 Tax=Diploscapter pachys TaxID=2018661 RepID=A0A2A2L209_9BILA|nr:hypothetical protein WR25_08698 [Diploscapter pachys]